MLPDARRKAERFDARFRPFLDRIGVPLLRISLGVVFLWFGLLKVFDVSPVAGLVAKTIYWFDPISSSRCSAPSRCSSGSACSPAG